MRAEPARDGGHGAEHFRGFVRRDRGSSSTDTEAVTTPGIERNHLIIGGMRGNTCVEGTARAAVELGYLTLVKDASATFRPAEWTATFEVNAPTFAHAVVNTSEAVAMLGS